MNAKMREVKAKSELPKAGSFARQIIGRIPKWMDTVWFLPIALRKQEGVSNLMADHVV
jgi:hypothetical protein